MANLAYFCGNWWQTPYIGGHLLVNFNPPRQKSAMSFLSEPLAQFRLAPTWQGRLGGELKQEYIRRLRAFLVAEREEGRAVYPPEEEIFAAFDHTPFPAVKVVILGQDPYHGAGQANGLAFSVRPGEKIPPSLGNIFKELEADLGVAPSAHGDLRAWADQGVLLLNSVLTGTAGQAGAHQGRGWEEFTRRVLVQLNQERQGLVFLLWGREAQSKGELLDPSRHLVLNSSHPSPLSAYRGFLGCRHFSKTNEYLLQHHQQPVDWRLPSELP